MQSRTITTILVSLLLASSVAYAEPDAATKEKARGMGLKGLGLYDGGDFKGALEQFEQAWRLYPAPTLGLYSARALAKVGRLTAASARYLQVMRMALPADASAQFKQATADAESERAALVERIPRLRVEVAGANGTATVSIDGAVIAAQDLSTGIPLNPGAHDVRGQQGTSAVTMQVALQDGETKTVTLDFTQGAVPVPAPTPAPPPTSPASGNPPAALPIGPSAPSPDAGPTTGRGSGASTFGWVLIGVGGVGIGVGAVTGLIANGKKGDLEGACHPDIEHCPESSRTDVDQYNTLRTSSTVGFVVGGVGLAGGALLLLTAREKASSPGGGGRSARVTPWVGPGSAGVWGRF